MSSGALNAKQHRFCQEYIADLNGKQAAIRAGYSEKTAESQASRLLSNAKVKAEIQKLMDSRSERTEITADAVLAELAKLAFANMEDYTSIVEGCLTSDLSNVTRDQMAAIQEFTVDTVREKGEDGRTIDKFRFKLADKKGNLELLGKHLKLFTEKVEHSGSIGVSDLTDDELARIAAGGS